jgi:hypothetical protein
MALEAVVHRADTDAATGKTFSVASDVAADGIDEYLDVFVAASRAAQHSPSGPVIGFECSDRGEGWWLDLSEPGGRLVSREPLAATVRLRGDAEDLLLAIWGRIPMSSAGLEELGDVEELKRWSELVPPM